MAEYLSSSIKVAVKGLGNQYKLMEASEEFNLCMTSQSNLLASHLEGIPRTDRDPVQYCQLLKSREVKRSVILGFVPRIFMTVVYRYLPNQ
jgi:hypothetical protein